MIKSLRLLYHTFKKSLVFFLPQIDFKLLILFVEWEQEYKMDSEDCLNVDQMDECQQNNRITTSLIQPTMSSQIPTTGSHTLTSNSTNIGNR